MAQIDFSALLIDNLQRYNTDFRKAANLITDPDRIINGLHFSDAFMQTLLHPEHPDYRDAWRMLLWEICCDAPLLFHVTETNFRTRQQIMQLPDGRTVPVCYPVPEISLADYRKMLETFLPEWIRFSADIQQKTAGCSTLAAALITALEINKRCRYDYTYSHNAIRNVLHDGIALCWGFTGCFNAVMRQLGYRAEPVFTWDLGGEEHAWSALFIPEQNRWCEIDVTWMNNTHKDKRFIDLCFFDCASGDKEGFPQHYAEKPESVLLVTDPPVIDLSYSKGIGYQYLDHSRVVTEITHLLSNQFRLTFDDGSEEILQL